MESTLTIQSLLGAEVNKRIAEFDYQLGANNIAAIEAETRLRLLENMQSTCRWLQAQQAIEIEQQQLYLDHPSGALGSTRDMLRYAGVSGSKLSDLSSIASISTWAQARDIPLDHYIVDGVYSKLAEGIPFMKKCQEKDDIAGMKRFLKDIDKVVENNQGRAVIRKKYRSQRDGTEPMMHFAFLEPRDSDRTFLVAVGPRHGPTRQKLAMILSKFGEFDLVGDVSETSRTITLKVVQPR